MTKIAFLIGSLRHESFNRKLAGIIESVAPDGTAFVYADIANLPLFNEELEADFPVEATQLKETIRSADAVIIVSPEYNRGIPGVLKNAIDWASRPSGENSFRTKPVALAGVSSGKLGTAVAQSQLREILVYLEARLMGQPEVYVGPSSAVFDESGKVDQKTLEQLERFITRFNDHITL